MDERQEEERRKKGQVRERVSLLHPRPISAPHSTARLTTNSASPTSLPKSPTKTEYSPSHLGCRPGSPVPQLSLNVRELLGMSVGGLALNRERMAEACEVEGKVRKQ